jgi:hypothetical protein
MKLLWVLMLGCCFPESLLAECTEPHPAAADRIAQISTAFRGRVTRFKRTESQDGAPRYEAEVVPQEIFRGEAAALLSLVLEGCRAPQLLPGQEALFLLHSGGNVSAIPASSVLYPTVVQWFLPRAQ